MCVVPFTGTLVRHSSVGCCTSCRVWFMWLLLLKVACAWSCQASKRLPQVYFLGVSRVVCCGAQQLLRPPSVL